MELRIAIGDYGLRSGHVSVGADFARGAMHLYTGYMDLDLSAFEWVGPIGMPPAHGDYPSLEIDIHASFPSPWFGARAYMNGGSAALVIVHSFGLWD